MMGTNEVKNCAARKMREIFSSKVKVSTYCTHCFLNEKFLTNRITGAVCIRIAIQNESRTGLLITPGLIGGVAVEADQVVGRPGEVVELVLEVLRPGAQVRQQQVTHLRAPAHTHTSSSSSY
jgi:hypothetical protein